jgi:RNA polymerase sigma-70 factor (ECF subfamily)
VSPPLNPEPTRSDDDPAVAVPTLEAAVAEPGDENDEALVTDAQSGSMEAFDALVTRYRGRIYGMTMNMLGNEADARDITQEVFIKAWRNLPNFERRSQFFTWLCRIANNAVIDLIRKKKISGPEFNDELGSVPAVGAPTAPRHTPAPDRAMVNQEIGVRIREALDKLSPEHRAVILLKEIEGLSYQEIADTVDCAIGTVMSRLFNARKRLQEMLSDLYAGRREKQPDAEPVGAVR